MTWRDRAIKVEDAPPSDGGWRSRAIQDIQGPPSENNSVMDKVVKFLKDHSGAIQNVTAGPIAGPLNAVEDYVLNNPKKAALQAADQLPGVMGAALPLAATVGTVGVGAPAAIGLAGFGAAGGEGLRQVARRALGENPTPKVQLPFVGDVPQLPGVSPEISNMIEQGGISAAAQGIGEGIKSAAGPIADAASDFAQTRGAKALGFTKRFLKTPQAIEEAKGTAQEMLDNGVITPFAGAETMSDRVENLINEKGKAIGDFLKERGGGFDTQSAVNAINSVRPVDSSGQWLRGGAYDKINSMLDTALDTVQAHKDVIPFEEANKLKGLLQSIVNWKGTNLESETGKQIAGAMRGAVDTSLGNVAEGADPQAMQQFLKDKSTYSAGLRAQDALSNRMSSEFGNKTVGLTDTIAGAGELAAGNPMGAGALVGGKKVLERFGNQATAWTADKVAKILQVMPEVFGHYAPGLLQAAARGANALATTQFILAKREPEFQEIMKKIGGNQDEH